MASFNKDTLPSSYSDRPTESTDAKRPGSGNDQAEMYCAFDDFRGSLSLLYLQEYGEDTATKAEETIHTFQEPTPERVLSVAENANVLQQSPGETNALPVT